jgi:hypothetical protein
MYSPICRVVVMQEVYTRTEVHGNWSAIANVATRTRNTAANLSGVLACQDSHEGPSLGRGPRFTTPGSVAEPCHAANCGSPGVLVCWRIQQMSRARRAKLRKAVARQRQ